MPAHLRENSKYLLFVSFFLAVLTLITFNVQNISAAKRVLGAATSRASSRHMEKDYWLTFLEENPGYFDGWVELAVLEYEEGNLDQASRYYLKAKTINPNSEKLPW